MEEEGCETRGRDAAVGGGDRRAVAAGTPCTIGRHSRRRYRRRWRRAEGIYFTGVDGTRYIDFNSQLMGVNIGHRDDACLDAIARQAETLPYITPFMVYEDRARLGQKIAELRPGDIEKSFYTLGGAEPNENAMQGRPAVHGPAQDHGAIPLVPRGDGGGDDAHRRSASLGERARDVGRRARPRSVSRSAARRTTRRRRSRCWTRRSSSKDPGRSPRSSWRPSPAPTGS